MTTRREIKVEKGVRITFKMTSAKSEIITGFTDSDSSRAFRALEDEKMGGRTPSQFYRDLKKLVSLQRPRAGDLEDPPSSKYSTRFNCAEDTRNKRPAQDGQQHRRKIPERRTTSYGQRTIEPRH